MNLKYFVTLALALTVSTAFAGKHDHSSLLKKCADQCPDATEETLSKCLEEKENDPAFKASACGIAHAQHEKKEKRKKAHAH